MIPIKLPPQAMDLEEAVIGAAMLQPETLYEVEYLQPAHFYNTKNSIVWQAISHLRAHHQKVDILTVKTQLKTTGELDKIGGAVRLAEYTERVASAANIKHHAQIIYTKYADRKVIEEFDRMVNAIYGMKLDAPQALEMAADLNLKLVLEQTRRAGRNMDEIALSFIERMEQVAQADGKPLGISSGLPIDIFTRGFQAPRMYVIGARPAMGKTDFMLNLALAASKQGNPAGVLSLEMGDNELFQRLVAREGALKKSDLENGSREYLERPEVRKKLLSASQSILKSGIQLRDMGSADFNKIRQAARELVLAGVKILFIDYLGLINFDKGMNKTDAVGEITRRIKMEICKEMDLPVVVLHQLSRDCEKRPDKRPILSDLRSSGDIEQDADFVGFLYRPEYYGFETDDEGNHTGNLCELIIAKNRQGRTQTAKMQYYPETGEFVAWTGYGMKSTPFANGIDLPMPNGTPF